MVKKEKGKGTWACTLCYVEPGGKRRQHVRRGFEDAGAARRYAQDFEKRNNDREDRDIAVTLF